jgi:zinc protease
MRRILACLCLLLVPLAAPGEPAKVHEYQLDNGLKLLVRPDHRAPVVVSQVWYRVGSSYEYRGVTGISHVLEHMMFKGTERLEPGEFSRIIAREGGRENAFTSRDYTGYYQQLSADRLPIAMELEAERMHRLQFSADEFAREIEVVKEERRQRTEDNPTALMMERFFATAYPASTYRQPIVGWMEDLDNMTLEDVEAWYRRWYSPSNAIVVVVGDVDPDAVHALAEQHFGAVPARKIAPARPVSDIEAPGERRIRVRIPAELPVLAMGFQVPSLATAEERWEPYALEVMANVLDGGAAARLPTRLVRGQEIAAAAGAGYSMATRLEGQFLFSARPAPGQEIDALERALREEIARLHKEPVDPQELERAKNQIMADHLFELDSIANQATQLGVLETTGIGWQELDRYEEGIRSVTAEQIQAVARRYLVPERLTVGVLDPIRASRSTQGEPE